MILKPSRSTAKLMFLKIVLLATILEICGRNSVRERAKPIHAAHVPALSTKAVPKGSPNKKPDERVSGVAGTARHSAST
eukprot:CAMPEP_0172659426 /NCGR_PEP_ID=MMETSP1074-20121228/3424_1 /TAXON_ID=2916 /ORGANISM="Ceratium fusus, Strain PA161109" /LENGTH=78 /DNA_ID=CAMNT_0013474903 /DNA_START=348 /DNA_END=584 /DNA_ORIENTATION=+